MFHVKTASRTSSTVNGTIIFFGIAEVLRTWLNILCDVCIRSSISTPPTTTPPKHTILLCNINNAFQLVHVLLTPTVSLTTAMDLSSPFLRFR
jgi:hypothetical protein